MNRSFFLAALTLMMLSSAPMVFNSLAPSLASCPAWLGGAQPASGQEISHEVDRGIHAMPIDDYPGLPHLIRASNGLYIGGAPDEQGFSSLRKLGVQVVLSVDGAPTDVKAAEAAGLRYIHLPHGYDAISPERQRELAKVLASYEDVYVHCHHGRHRAPAAAAVGAIGAGRLTKQQGLKLLKVCGCSEEYRGLYQCVRTARRIPARELQAWKTDFIASAKPPTTTASMAAISRHWDQLRTGADARWKADSPQFAATTQTVRHAALQLLESLVEFQRSHRLAAAAQPAGTAQATSMDALLTAAIEQMGEVRELVEQHAQKPSASTHRRLGTALRQTKANCQRCHRRFRN